MSVCGAWFFEVGFVFANSAISHLLQYRIPSSEYGKKFFAKDFVDCFDEALVFSDI